MAGDLPRQRIQLKARSKRRLVAGTQLSFTLHGQARNESDLAPSSHRRRNANPPVRPRATRHDAVVGTLQPRRTSPLEPSSRLGQLNDAPPRQSPVYGPSRRRNLVGGQPTATREKRVHDAMAPLRHHRVDLIPFASTELADQAERPLGLYTLTPIRAQRLIGAYDSHIVTARGQRCFKVGNVHVLNHIKSSRGREVERATRDRRPGNLCIRH